MPIEPIYSKPEQQEIINHIAAAGESYKYYLEFHNRMFPHKERHFTEKYFYRWCQRHRDKLRKAKERRKTEVQRISMFNRENRIAVLEAKIELLEQAIGDGDIVPGDLVKLIDEQRKLLEQVAKERGEWNNVKDVRPEDAPSYRPRDAALERLQRSQKPKVIEGEKPVVVNQDAVQS